MTDRNDLWNRLEELENDLRAGDGEEFLVVFEDADTGEWTDSRGGDPIDRDELDDEPDVIIRDTVVETDWSGDDSERHQ